MSEATLSANTDFALEYNVPARIPEYPSILAAWHEQSTLLRSRLPGRYDLQYGASAIESLDYFPAANHAQDAPLLVFIHGGFWRRLHKDDFTWVAPAYVERGVSVAVLNYGLAPSTSLDEIVRQTQGAMAWLYRHAAELGFNRNRIVVSGHSAGGQLACMMLATDWPAFDTSLPNKLLAGCVALSPLSDLAPLAHVPAFQDDLDFTPERIAAFSPVRLKPIAGAPLIGAVGGKESDEFKRQLALIASAWPSCWQGEIAMPADDHLSLCEAFATPGTPLFNATLALIAAN